jgi:WD40 repeat protein
VNNFYCEFPAIDNQGSFVITSSNDSVHLWGIPNGQLIRSFIGHSGPCRPIGFSNNNIYSFTFGLEDSSIRVWEVYTGINTMTYHPYPSSPTVAGLTPDGQHIVVGYKDGTMLMLDVSKALDVQSDRKPLIENLDLLIFPNPITNQSKIEISVPSRDWYTLSIYDMLGLKKATLFDGISDEGKYIIPLGASINDFPSGSYVFSIESSKQQISKIGLLVK